MKNQLKGFMLGSMLTLIIALSFNTFAEGFLKQIEVSENSVKIQVNGKDLIASNFVYNGRTYCQIRNLTDALDKDLQWNANTKTMNIIDRVKSSLPTEDIKDSVDNKPTTPKSTQNSSNAVQPNNILTSNTTTNTQNNNNSINLVNNSSFDNNNINTVNVINNPITSPNALTQEELDYLKTVKEKINKHSDKYDFILSMVKQARIDDTKINESDIEKSKDSVYQEYLYFKTNIPPLKFVDFNKKVFTYFDKLFVSYTFLGIFRSNYRIKTLFFINSANENLQKILSNIESSTPILQSVYSEINNYIK